MSDKNWLALLKVGDKVIISGNNAFGLDVVAIVSRLTKTQILVKRIGNENEYKYKLKDGRSVGTGTWETQWLYEATPEKLEEIILRNKRSKIKRYVTETVDWNTVPRDVIDQLYVLLDSFVKKDKSNA